MARMSPVKSSLVQSSAGRSAPARRRAAVLRYMLAALNSRGSWYRFPLYMKASTRLGCTSRKYSPIVAASRWTKLSRGTASRSANSWVPSVATYTRSGAWPAATMVRILEKKSPQSALWTAWIRTGMSGCSARNSSTSCWRFAASWDVPWIATVRTSSPRPGMSEAVRRGHAPTVAPARATPPTPSSARRVMLLAAVIRVSSLC